MCAVRHCRAHYQYYYSHYHVLGLKKLFEKNHAKKDIIAVITNE